MQVCSFRTFFFVFNIYFIHLESHKFEKRIVLLLGLWNTISRIVSFDYNVLSALRPGPSESNFEKAGGSLPGDGCVKWQFANVCKVSVTEGGVRGARPEVGGGRCRQYPGLAATPSSDTGHWPGADGGAGRCLSMDHGTASTKSPDKSSHVSCP